MHLPASPCQYTQLGCASIIKSTSLRPPSPPDLSTQGALFYKPRALFVDLSGSLGGVSLGSSSAAEAAAAAAAAAAGSSVSSWSGRVAVHHAERVPKSGFMLRLEEGAEFDGNEDGEGAGRRVKGGRFV